MLLIHCLFIVTLVMFFSTLCLSSFAFILIGKRELVDLLYVNRLPNVL